MHELEFRKRVCANPGELDRETLDAASANPAFQKILDETLQLERDIVALTRSVSAPDTLAERLLNIPASENSIAGGREASKPSSNNFFQYYAMAASLLLALGIGAVVVLGGGPSSSEIAFGSDVIRHLYHEVTEIDAINDGTYRATATTPNVADVMAQAGTQFNDEEFLRAIPVRFAKICVVLPDFNGAHLMVEGNLGTVNVILIKNSPVTSEYTIQDDRFRGMVVPMEEGNMILIGEQDENLEELKSMFAQNVEWAI